jgi:hypothetical protein
MESSLTVSVALALRNVDLSTNIFLPIFLIAPFFSRSKTFLLTLSLGIFRSFEISEILIFSISRVLSL